MKNVTFDRTTILQLDADGTDRALDAAADCDALRDDAALNLCAIVPGLMPNLAAILRTPGLRGLSRASRIRFSRAGALRGHPRRFPSPLTPVRAVRVIA
jgi:hypothetical protein